MNKVKYIIDFVFYLLHPCFIPYHSPASMISFAETGIISLLSFGLIKFWPIIEPMDSIRLISFFICYCILGFMNSKIGNRYFTEEKKEEIEQKFAHIRISRFMSFLCNFALLIICDVICIFAICLSDVIYK